MTLSFTTACAWSALLSATTLSIGAVAHASEESSDTAQQIAQLRAANEALAAKVNKLEANAQAGSQEGHWLTEQRADEIRAIVSDVLADSNARTSLQSSGATAGWNKDQGGFFIASPSGDFKMNIKGQIQARWVYNHRDNAGLTGSARFKEDAWGFENRRTKIGFGGFVGDPSWSYLLKLIFNRSPGSLSSGDQTYSNGNIVASIEDAWIQKDFGNGVALRVGQFKAPYIREELVTSGAQLLVERSMVNDVFSTKFSQGIQLELGGRAGDPLRAQLFYGDGFRANATSVPTSSTAAAGGYGGSYTTSFSQNLTNYAFAGRLEWLGAGQWKQFNDLTSYRGEEFGWMLGFGGMAQSLRPGTDGAVSDATTSSMWGATADLSVDFGGANVFVYGVYRHVSLTGEVDTRGGESDAMDQFGAVVQGGYFLSNEVEVFARYEFGNTDTDKFRTAETDAQLELDSTATAGFNYYFGGNKDVKLTMDFGYAFDSIGDFNNSGADWLQDGTTTTGDGHSNDGQWVCRTQLQLLF